MEDPHDYTIASVAASVLKDAAKPLEVDEILDRIVKGKLYTFNTPDPKTVLREQIRRHCEGLDRTLVYEPLFFRIRDDGTYEHIHSKTSTRMSTMRRIQRSVDKEPLIKALTQGDQAVFGEIWKLLLFAAQLGFSKKRREPLGEIAVGRGIDQTSFANSPAWWGLLYMLSLCETSDADCLSGSPEADNRRATIFEEYANGGLSLIQECLENRGYSLDGFLGLLTEHGRSMSTGQPKLAELKI